MPYNYKVQCPTCSDTLHFTSVSDHGRRVHSTPFTKEQIKGFIVECVSCGAIMAHSEIKEHLQRKHSLSLFTTRSTKPVQPSDSPAIDSIRSAEKQIQSAILALENDRDQLHARIVEIDNLVAKYKKFNGHS